MKQFTGKLNFLDNIIYKFIKVITRVYKKIYSW